MILKVLRYLMLALLISTTGAAYAYSNIVRCIFIDFSDLNEIQNNLYVSEHIHSSGQKKISSMIKGARLRLAEHYGKPNANPVIIVTGSEEEAQDFGLYDHPGSLFFTPWDNYLILNFHKAGLDVTSHELVHAEVVERLGYFARQREIPTWFDEGAALQVDFRPHYTKITDINNAELDRVTALNSPEQFWSRDKDQNIKNYQSAKVAVAKFFRENPSKSLYALLEEISKGKRFDGIVKNEN